MRHNNQMQIPQKVKKKNNLQSQVINNDANLLAFRKQPVGVWYANGMQIAQMLLFSFWKNAAGLGGEVKG